MRGLNASNAVILGSIAVIILLIAIFGIAKNYRKGWRWVLALLAAAALG
jgi:lipoprotein signal peptidase